MCASFKKIPAWEDTLIYKLCQEFWKKGGRGSLNLYCNGGVASILVKITFGSRSSADNSPLRKKKPPSKVRKSRLRNEAWLEKRRTENPPAPPAPPEDDVHVIYPALVTFSIAPDPSEDSGGKEVNQEQTTDSLGERQRENRIRTQNTDWRRDNENWEIMSLFYVLFIMSDRMTESYKDWIDQSRLVIPNHLLRHIRRTCKGFVTGGRRKIPV